MLKIFSGGSRRCGVQRGAFAARWVGGLPPSLHRTIETWRAPPHLDGGEPPSMVMDHAFGALPPHVNTFIILAASRPLQSIKWIGGPPPSSSKHAWRRAAPCCNLDGNYQCLFLFSLPANVKFHRLRTSTERDRGRLSPTPHALLSDANICHKAPASPR